MNNDKMSIKFELIRQELDNVQSSIRNYDVLSMDVKKWAVATFTAVIFFSFEHNLQIGFVVGVISIILFWLVEAIFKSIQGVYIKRSNEIELFLNNQLFEGESTSKELRDFKVPNTGQGFALEYFEKWRDIFQKAVMLHTSFIYIVMIIILILLLRGAL